MIAIADVTRGHRHGVGPEVGLGDRVGRDHVATADRGQVPAFLLLGAVEGQRQLNGPHLGVLGKDETIVSAGVTQGFHGQESRREVLAGAAIFRGHRQANDPELGALLPEFAVEYPFGVTFDHSVVEGLPKLADALAQRPLIFGRLEVH